MAPLTRFVVRYRTFEEDDLFEVLQLANATLDENYDGGLFLHFARLYPDGFLVCEEEDDERVVGFIVGTVQRAYEARILALAVDPPYRRAGVGSRLVNMFLDAFRAFGVRRVTLEVRVSNEAAIELYEHLGFEQKGTLPRYYADAEDAYVMARTI